MFIFNIIPISYIWSNHCFLLSDLGFLSGSDSKESAYNASGKAPYRQCKRHKRRGFNPWVGRSPRGGHGNPLQYWLENPCGQRSLAGYSPMCHKESDTNEVAEHIRMPKYTNIQKLLYKNTEDAFYSSPVRLGPSPLLPSCLYSMPFPVFGTASHILAPSFFPLSHILMLCLREETFKDWPLGQHLYSLGHYGCLLLCLDWNLMHLRECDQNHINVWLQNFTFIILASYLWIYIK